MSVIVFFSDNVQLGYEVIETNTAHNIIHSYLSEDISNSLFLYDCKGCSFCICCNGLENKKYHIFNKEVTQKEFEKIKGDILSNRKVFLTVKNKYLKVIEKHKNRKHIINSQKSSGNKIYNSKNAASCFLVREFEDVSFGEMGSGVKSCYDNLRATENENCYETASTYKIVNSAFIFNSLELTNCYYCETCSNLQDCFGCVGLKNAQYCILNKQYTKEQYISLKEKIIQGMKDNGDWGEFFPLHNSQYCYNESLAQQNFPLTKDQITQQGLKFKEDELTTKYIGERTQLPKNITSTPHSILTQILECQSCKKNYRLVEAELNLYRKIGVAVPDICPKCRNKARIKIMGKYVFE